MELSAYNVIYFITLYISFVTLLCPFAYWATLSLKVNKTASMFLLMWRHVTNLINVYKQYI